MRILHLLHTSLPHVCGYSLRSDQIVSLQAQLGLDLAVLTSAQQPRDANDDGFLGGVRHFRTAHTRLLPSPLRELQLIGGLARRIDQVCRDFKPQIVHAHSPVLVGFPAMRAARRLGIPFVYEIRDLWENASVDRGKFTVGSLPYRGARALETYTMQRTDAVFTIGENLRQELASRTKSMVYVTPNGVDVDKFVPELCNPEWQARWNPNGRDLLAYVGSFQPYEGLDVLLRALPLMKRVNPSVSLLVAGDGPERSALERLATDLGIQSDVRFAGRVPHTQVREIYSVADLLVYPRVATLTTRLTTPLKPLEAMSAGKAVLASDLPPLRELIDNDLTGWLFQAGSSESLADKALTLLASPRVRETLGASARQSVLERTWKSSVERYIPVYETLLGLK